MEGMSVFRVVKASLMLPRVMETEVHPPGKALKSCLG